MNAPFNPGSGFGDPVLGPQAVFRVVLQATSRPGLIYDLPDAGVRGPDALPREALSVLLALCDHDTPVWFDDALRASTVARWLAFHAGAPTARAPAEAAFAVLRPGVAAPSFETFALGDARYPDRSTTLLVICDDLEGGAPMTLEGPGIESRVTLAPRGLPEHFVAQMQDNHRMYPRGLDVLLLAGARIVGLPRSTRITMEQA